MRKIPGRPGKGRELTRKARPVNTRPPSPCVHCGTPGRRPKGLCWRCHSTPEINSQYQSTSKFRPLGEKDFIGSVPLAEPTDALPGTDEKVRVMESRAALGLALFHPLDAGMGIDDATERRLRLLGMSRGEEPKDHYED